MLAIELRFPTGRVKMPVAVDDAPGTGGEWPPSPARLLVALACVEENAVDGDDPGQRRALVSSLAASPPCFLLPQAFTDADGLFVAPDATVRLVWPLLELDAGKRRLLGALLERLAFAELVAAVFDDPPGAFDAVPAFNARADAHETLVPVLCVRPSHAASLGGGADAQPFGAKSCELLAYRGLPERLLPRPCPPPPPRGSALPTLARFRFTGAVRPLATDTLSVMERRVRPALLRLSNGASVFVGRDSDNTPLRGHRHAHFFGEARNDGRLSHLVVHAPMGFDDRAVKALRALNRLWARGEEELTLALDGLGDAANPRDAGGSALCGLGTVWRSATPFVSTRHPKTRAGAPLLDAHGVWVGSAQHDLLRLLEAKGFPRPVQVDLLDEACFGTTRLPWTRFVTTRRTGAGVRAMSPPAGFRLRFAHPVQGPIAIGYGAHFGLGVFRTEPPLD